MLEAMKTVAIIGAGVAGMSAAWSLRNFGRQVVVFEKSRGVSGRATTRRRDECCYDHGANFFRTEDPEVHEIVHQVLPTDELVKIPGEVWLFDAEGKISAGDTSVHAQRRYSYRHGINTLGKLLAKAAGVDVRRQTRIASMEQAANGWTLRDENGSVLGSFAEVVLTPPAPQVAKLLAASSMDPNLQAALAAPLAKADYEKQLTFILGFEKKVARPQPFHALLNPDEDHEITWLSFEDDKRGHVPDGQTILIVQMSSHWSVRHYDVPPEHLVQEVTDRVRRLLPAVSSPTWWDSQRWRFARPISALPPADVQRAEQEGLYIAGDALEGRGRIPIAMKSGLQTARRLQQNHLLATG